MIDRRLFQNFDYKLLTALLLLSIFGVMMVHTATFRASGDYYSTHQSWWIVLGLCGFLLASAIDYRQMIRNSLPLYIINMVLLGAVFITGRTVGGASSWFHLGPAALQPSEFAKITTLLLLSDYLSRQDGNIDGIVALLPPIGITALPMGLIILQPDMGTALTFVPMILAVLLATSNKMRLVLFTASPLIGLLLFPYKMAWIIYLVVLGALLWFFWDTLWEKIFFWGANIAAGFSGAWFWSLLKDYQKKRFLVFIDPEIDPLGAGYNIIQSKIAVGSGGIWGKGYMLGTQNQLDFLPAQHTDFIFSVLGEEGGFVWSAALIFVFMILLLFIALVGLRSKTASGAILSAGIMALLGFHIFINIGMSIGIMPVTGLPLPFISYGGSSLFTFMFMLGILNSISMRKFIF